VAPMPSSLSKTAVLPASEERERRSPPLRLIIPSAPITPPSSSLVLPLRLLQSGPLVAEGNGNEQEAARGQEAFFRGREAAEEEIDGVLLDIACSDACNLAADDELADGRADEAEEEECCPAADDACHILTSPVAPRSPLEGGAGCGTDDSKKQFVVPKNIGGTPVIPSQVLPFMMLLLVIFWSSS